MEKKQIIRTLKLAAGAIFLSLMLGIIMPGIRAGTVQAKSCRHEIFAWEEILAPTCAREGKKSRICQECDAVLETAPIRKSDHKGAWKTTREATCTKEGIRSFICKNCNAVIETKPVPKKNHSYKWVTTKSATCAAVGRKERKCKNCGSVCETKVLEMKKHKWGSWQIKKAATCHAEGTKVRTCTVCKKTESESIKATGKHKYGNWEVKSITVCGRTVKLTQIRSCMVCKTAQKTIGKTASFGKQHSLRSYYFKHTPKSGRVVILCADCHKSVTGVVSDGIVDFTRPSKDNSRLTSKGWMSVYDHFKK